jgi:predicted nucleotidyltransferase
MDAVAIDLPYERIAEICAAHDVAELSLFGSAAKGELGPDSDYDFLVVFKHPENVTLFDLSRLHFALEDLLGRKVDIGPKHGLKPLIRDEVLASARVVYAAE